MTKFNVTPCSLYGNLSIKVMLRYQLNAAVSSLSSSFTVGSTVAEGLL